MQVNRDHQISLLGRRECCFVPKEINMGIYVKADPKIPPIASPN